MNDLPPGVANLQQLMRGGLPGRNAQAAMAPELSYGRQFGPPRHDARHSAVLIALFERDGRWCTTLTRRNPDLKVHAGQICLPGGAQDPGETAAECAHREWTEELGEPPPDWRFLGELSPVYVFVSNHFVRPFVVYGQPPAYRPNPAEVAGVIELPLEALRDPAAAGCHPTQRWGTHFLSPHFEYQNELIWGATAVILAEFVAITNSSLLARGQ